MSHDLTARLFGGSFALIEPSMANGWLAEAERALSADAGSARLLIDDDSGRMRPYEVRNGVAVVSMRGMIVPDGSLIGKVLGWPSARGISDAVRAAVEDEDVSAVVFDVDSPGGSPNELAETAATIRRASQTKPVAAYVGGAGASAAYWLISATSAGEGPAITVGATASVGSIGAKVAVTQQEQPNMAGEREFIFTSANASRKHVDPTTEEGQATAQSHIDSIETPFINDVVRYRSVSADDVRAIEGALRVGSNAVSAGLADQVGTMDSVMSRVTRGNRRRRRRQGSQTAQGGRPTMANNETAANEAATGDDANAGVNALQAAGDVVQRCNDAGLPSLAQRLLSDGVTGDAAAARIAEAKEVKDVCASFNCAGVADTLVKHGLGKEDARAVLESVRVAISGDGQAVDTTVAADHGGSQPKTSLNPNDIYARRRQVAQGQG